MSDTGVNWKGIIFWVLAIALIAFVVLFYFDVAHFKTNLVAFVHSIGIPKLNLSFTGITDFLKNNATLLTVGTTLGMAAITGFIKSYQTNKLLDKTIEESQKKLAQQEATANAKVAEIQNKLAGYEGDTTADELQNSLTKALDSNQLWETKYTELQKNFKALQTQLDARPVIQTTRIA